MTDKIATTEAPSLAGAAWLVRPETRAVLAALAAAGYPARVVGGAVRNALIGLPVDDIDIATPALPEAVIAACEVAGLATIATGLQHGTVTVVANHRPHEVTTLRRDVVTDGRHATVDFTEDWAADAGRRDFTINALYCDAQGQIHDPLGGLADLLARRVRFIGDANARIAEDYLRILRFFRFHAVLGAGDPDPAGLAACVRGRDGIGQLSAERIRAELVKLLVAPRALDAIDAMAAWGLLTAILHVAPRHGVLRALIAAEAALGAAPDPMLRLSALALAVVEDVRHLARRLKLSTAERRALLVVDRRLGEAVAGLDPKAARRALYELGPRAWRRRILGALAAGAIGEAAAADLHGLPERWPVPVLPVRGADLIALGHAPGPRIGAILTEIEAWWIEADFPPSEAVRGRLAAVAGGFKG